MVHFEQWQHWNDLCFYVKPNVSWHSILQHFPQKLLLFSYKKKKNSLVHKIDHQMVLHA